MTNIDLVQKDTASTLTINLNDKGLSGVDLTGASVKLVYFINSHPPTFEKVMTIVGDPKLGIVKYQFTSVVVSGVTTYDLSDPGVLHYQVRVTFSDSTVLTTPIESDVTIHPAFD